MTDTDRARRVGRAFAIALALLLPSAVLFALVTASTTQEAADIDRARAGVGYARAAGPLLGELATAQAAAARGDNIDGQAVGQALTAVDAADARLGATLSTTDRWTGLRSDLDGLARRAGAGPEAALAAGESAELVRGLLEVVADGTGVPGDGNSVRPLSEAAMVHLPALVSAAGRFAAGAAPAGPDDSDPQAAGPAAAAREAVLFEATRVQETLRRGVDVSAPATDPALLARIGDFGGAVADLGPSSALTGTADGALEGADRSDPAIRTAVDLQRAVLAELDRRLAGQAEGLTGGRVLAILAILLAVVVAGGLLWRALAPARPDLAREDDARPPEPSEDGVVMVDARSLLQADELVRVGRSVRKRPEYDDAQT
ncbi:MAG: hypothetical protein LH603_08235 [Pseudonocardia sp.]|nr:hypothetical protein [Pseudonocardia sp.]